MWMSKNEIARNYREAKHKKHQIYILADLNLCSVSEIKGILEEMGEIKAKKSPKIDMGDTLNTQKGEIEDKRENQDAANPCNHSHGEDLNTQKSNKRGKTKEMTITKPILEGVAVEQMPIVQMPEYEEEGQKIILTPGLKQLIFSRLDQLEVEIISCEKKKNRLEKEYCDLAQALGYGATSLKVVQQ